MEALQKLYESLDLEWTSPAKYQCVASLVCYLNACSSSQSLSLLWDICSKLALTEEESQACTQAFKLANPVNVLHFQLYKRLGLQGNLEVLAPLVEAYATRTPKFRPDMIPHINQELPSNNFSGAVFLTKALPTPELLKEFLSQILNDKNSASKLLKLWSHTLSQVTPELFESQLLQPLKRLMIRSPAKLPDISLVISYVGCDLSGFGNELLFPTVYEYFFNDKTSNSALRLFEQLCKKCSSAEELVTQLTKQKDLNESQASLVLKAIKFISPDSIPNPEPLLNYIQFLSLRVKAEDKKHIIAEALVPFVCQNPPQKIMQLITSNLYNAAFANLVSDKAMEVEVQHNHKSPLSLAVSLSLKLPEPLTPKLNSFLTEPDSPLFTLQNLSEAETLAVARCVRKALEAVESPSLVKAYARYLLSTFHSVRKFALANWFDHAEVLFLSLKEVLVYEALIPVFLNSQKSLIPKMVSSIKTPKDTSAFVSLITCEWIYSKKLAKYVVQKYSSVLAEFDEESCLSNYKVIALELLTPAFESIVGCARNYISNEVFQTQIQRKNFLEKAEFDPNFEGFAELGKVRKEVMEASQLEGDPTDKSKVDLAVSILWNKSVCKALDIFKGFTLSLKLRNSKEIPKEIKKTLYGEVLSIALKNYEIEDLRLGSWDFASALFYYSESFSKIYSDFSHAVLKSSLDIWSEKHLSRVLKYISKNISVQTLDEAEAKVLEKLVIWVVSKPGTSLRATAVTLLIEFIYARQFSDLDQVLKEVIQLLKTYSSPTLSSIFGPLSPLMHPGQWKPFFDILMQLQPVTKKILMESILEFQDEIPKDKWAVCPTFISLFEEDQMVTDLAKKVWDKYQFELFEEVILESMSYLFSENRDVQQMVARAFANAIETKGWVEFVVRESSKEFARRTKHKHGFAYFLKLCVGNLNTDLVLETIELILDKGMREQNSELRDQLVEVGIQILNKHGEHHVDSVFQILETRTESQEEHLRHASVVMLGFLAGFFGAEDSRIENTLELLLKALDIPSDMLASTVSRCLPKLVSYRPHLIEDLLQKQMEKVFAKTPLKERKGPAYGVGSLVKGAGVKSLGTFSILESLSKTINNKKALDHEKGGVLLVIEGISSVLGRAFEPYLGEVLPFIIDCFSDNNLQEQAATTAKVLISKLSAHGMKRILPLLTHGVEETKWRSKVGAIEALGKLAFCAPKQLSACLPEIVPQVIKAFSDTNTKVLEAAKHAISDIGSVITNPEIFQTVPVLTKALGDISALNESFKVLLDTNFYHYLDSASLSLVIPLVETGLRSRSADLKKQACQIIGAITKLIYSPQEIEPYIERISTALKAALTDSIPEVRNIAAQNVGAFCNGVGPELSGPIVEWLLSNLESSSGNIERSGAVHAYSEILLREDKWETQLSKLLEKCQDSSHIVRESYLGVFIFIPLNTLGKFENYLCRSLPVFLENLSHENEEVRKIAVRVMQIIIKTYSKNNLEILLNPLEKGLFDTNWKTRNSCITLIGEMLDILEMLSRRETQPLISQEHKNRILASIYILRSDHSGSVHVTAVQIWKNMVDNTPKFLMQLTPLLVLRIIQISDTQNSEIREIAGAAIHGLIVKYQQKVFSSYLKHFTEHFETYPKGVAFALRTVCESASRNLLINYSEPITKILGRLLQSQDPDFLKNAGGIFNDLYQKTFTEKPDPGVMSLLDNLVSYPLACKELLSFNNPQITKALLPKIIKAPNKGQVLYLVSDLVAEELVENMKPLFKQVLQELKDDKDLLESLQVIIASMQSFDTLDYALDQLQEQLDSQNVLRIIEYFIKHTKVEITPFIEKILSIMLPALKSNQEETIQVLPQIFKQLTSPIQKEELPEYFDVFFEQIAEADKVPVFNSPKGLDPFLPLLQNTLLYGEGEVKVNAALGYCKVISLTEPKPLEAYAINIAGPLIRVLSDRVPGEVKVGILDALHSLLQKASPKLKPFVSQLQTTFINSLSHPTNSVREAASRNIQELLKMKPRVDLLVTKLASLKAEEPVVVSFLSTLLTILPQIQVSQVSKTNALNSITKDLNEELSGDTLRLAGKVIGQLSEDFSETIQELPPMDQTYEIIGGLLSQVTQEINPILENFLSTESGVQLMQSLAKADPYKSLDLAMHFKERLLELLPTSRDFFMAVPSSEYNRRLDEVQSLLCSLATYSINTPEESQELVSHLFAESKFQGIEKVSQSLDPSLQQLFSQYAKKLI